jgi:hypothetical protein
MTMARVGALSESVHCGGGKELFATSSMSACPRGRAQMHGCGDAGDLEADPASRRDRRPRVGHYPDRLPDPEHHSGDAEAARGILRLQTVIGATGGKIGFWGVMPVAQSSGTDQAAANLGNTNGEIAGLTISDPPTQAEFQALRDKCEELADDVRALSALVHALRAGLVAVGVVKGGA